MLVRFRLRYTFWLDLNKSEEKDIAEKIEELKAQRSFAKTVRDGIRLIWDMSQGRTDVLLELFPWIAEHFQGVAVAGLTADQVREIVRRETSENAVPSPMLVSGNLKSLVGSDKPLPGPDDHDDLAGLLEVKNVALEADSVVAQNLINSMLRSQHIKSDRPAKPSKLVKRERQSPEDLLEVRAIGSA
jgi:hypothetical protein